MLWFEWWSQRLLGCKWTLRPSCAAQSTEVNGERPVRIVLVRYRTITAHGVSIALDSIALLLAH